MVCARFHHVRIHKPRSYLREPAHQSTAAVLTQMPDCISTKEELGSVNVMKDFHSILQMEDVIERELGALATVNRLGFPWTRKRWLRMRGVDISALENVGGRNVGPAK